MKKIYEANDTRKEDLIDFVKYLKQIDDAWGKY